MTPASFVNLFPEFRAPSWDGWRGVLARLTEHVREFYAVAGRGAGKSRIVAVLAACFAAREYKRAPGERIYVGVFGPDRKQARLTFAYVAGLLRSVPELANLIERESRESLDLSNGVTVEVITASRAAPRGRSYALAIVEEAAFLPQDDSADPDRELVRALRPALARVPGSLLAVVSSPYARRGVLYEAWSRDRERPDPSVLVVTAPTLELNPTFDSRAIEKARAEDPVAAATEYDAQFRGDVEGFVTREAVEACVAAGEYELPPARGTTYRAFCDPSGGRSDSMTLAIGHAEEDCAVVDCLRERRAPFSPEAVVEEFAVALRAYGVSSVAGDRYGGEWPREAFRRRGVDYEPAPKAKSELYVDSLAALNSGRVDLPDNRRLVEQLCGLERRTSRAGKESVDHAPGGHDDLANAACGLIAMLTAGEELNPLEGRLVL